jgi:type I restriction enzyme S subunit
VQLREVAGVGAGNPAPQGTRYFEGGDYPFVRTQDVGRVHHDSGLAETTDKVNDIGVAECGLTLWPSRALLVPKSGASTFLNHRVLTAIEAYVSSHLAIVTAGRHVVPEYLYYWSLTLDARLVAPDNNYPSLRLSDLEEVWLPVPPLPVQERIVEILQRADAIRRKRQHALDLAEIILLASFIHMFGDPLENSNGFPTRPLGKLASVRSGVTKGRALGGKETVEAPYLRVANVQDGYLDLSEIKTVRVLPGELEKYRLEVGDVLMTEGGDPDKLGRGSIWHEQIPGCIYQNHVFRVRTDRDQLTPEYLAALLRTRYAKDYFFRCAKRTSNLASINSTQVKGLPVPVAPKDMQDRFVAAVSRWQDLSLRLTATLRTAVSTYQSLLNHAFTGKLTSEWEATRRDAIAAEQALHARLPQLVLLGFLREHARRAAGAAAAAGLWLTGLMKYAFLLQMEGAAKARLYHFVPYHFGPFARDVYTDLEVLREQGLIAVEPHGQENPAYGADNGGLLRVAEAIAPYGSTRPRKVETPRMDITVADTKAVDRTLQDLPVELREDIEAILDAYGDLAHNALLKAVYEKYPTFAKKSKLRGTTNKRRRGRAAAQRNKNSCGAIAETKPLSWVGRW